MGGDGQDQLFGGLGSDTFIFEALTAFNDVDQIHDFSLSEGDALDISDLISSYDPVTDSISDFVQVTDNGTNSYLAVDSDGGADNFIQIATIQGVSGLTDENSLEISGSLITV
jgi:Ca2+-binding RTX toxin-like protein